MPRASQREVRAQSVARVVACQHCDGACMHMPRPTYTERAQGTTRCCPAGALRRDRHQLAQLQAAPLIVAWAPYAPLTAACGLAATQAAADAAACAQADTPLPKTQLRMLATTPSRIGTGLSAVPPPHPYLIRVSDEKHVVVCGGDFEGARLVDCVFSALDGQTLFDLQRVRVC